MTIRPSTDRANSPTWEELDAICKGKSAMDLAEEIWRLRHDGPQDRKLILQLLEALLRCDRYCEHLDHSGKPGKPHYHGNNEPCPVQVIVEKAVSAGMAYAARHEQESE